MRTLLIDNYDSYTYNLYQLIKNCPLPSSSPKENGSYSNGSNGADHVCAEYADVDVITNNEHTWEQIKDKLEHNYYDNVVISPGPGSPDNYADFGICANVLKHGKTPVLGVCLGVQGLAHVYGGKVVRAHQPSHGKIYAIRFSSSSPLFKGYQCETFKAVRYHSLVVAKEHLPDCLTETAWTDDNGVEVIMGLEHKTLPLYGVQYHPESICSEMGIQLIANFMQLTNAYWKKRHSGKIQVPQPIEAPLNQTTSSPERKYRVDWRKVINAHSTHTTENAFLSLFAKEKNVFWLDSAGKDASMNKFTYMGKASQQHELQTDSWPCVFKYNASNKRIMVTDSAGVESEHGLREGTTFFDYVDTVIGTEEANTSTGSLPFMFHGGLVGYFGYEMSVECMPTLNITPSSRDDIPDSAFVFVDQLLVFDHQTQAIYIITATRISASVSRKEHQKSWLEQMQHYFEHESAKSNAHSYLQGVPRTAASGPIFSLARAEEQYLGDIQQCLEEIKAGESYELCLTNKVLTDYTLDALSLYLQLRHRNPAPYAAFFNFGGFQVCSCSPEKFLTIDEHKVVTTKPIKGTLPRGKSPQEDEELRYKLSTDEKSFSENLMIVDLMRNDLGRVCKTGSVHAPKLMAVESYATVHQLVSTIVGELRSDVSTAQCLQNIFPPGSMTGAPKLRSVEILDKLEGEKRGIYSGCLGFLGMNGTCDMSVVIRTVVVHKSGMNIGCGGAIVHASVSEDEYAEILLKASALTNSILASHSVLYNIPPATAPMFPTPPTKLYHVEKEEIMQN